MDIRIGFWLGALLLAAGCGGGDQAGTEDIGQEEEDLAAVSGRPTFGIGEAYPDWNVYERPDGGGPTAKQIYFTQFVSATHAGSTRIILDSSDVSNPAKMAGALRWARDVSTAGLDPYVTVTAPQGYNRSHYQSDVANIYRALAGHVHHFASINEPDLNGFAPEEAADYWAHAYMGLRSVCGKKCFVVAGEFAQVNDGSDYVQDYQARILKHVRTNSHIRRPRFWSMHDYADIVAGSPAHAHAFAKLLTNSPFSDARIWITECGALLKHGKVGPGAPTHLSGDADAQEKGGRLFLDLARDVPGVTRVFYYEIQAVPYLTNTWDSALLDWNGQPRPVFCAIVGAPRSSCPGSLKGAGI